MPTQHQANLEFLNYKEFDTTTLIGLKTTLKLPWKAKIFCISLSHTGWGWCQLRKWGHRRRGVTKEHDDTLRADGDFEVLE